MASLHEDVMTAARAAVVAAALDGIDAARVHTGAVPDTSNVVYPCVLVCLDGQRETLAPYDTEHDLRTLPVQLHLLDRQDRKASASWLPDWLAWRQAIADAFLMQVFPDDVEGNFHVEIEPTLVIDAQRILGRAYEDSAGGFTLKFLCVTDRIRPD